MDKKQVLDKKEIFLDSLINFSNLEFPQDRKITFPKITDFIKNKNILEVSILEF